MKIGQAEKQEGIERYIKDGSVELYEYLDTLLNNNRIGKIQASVCGYVFALQKVMQNPAKYTKKKDGEEIEPIARDLRSCEYTLLNSLNDRNIDMNALRLSCDFHAHNYVNKGM